MDRQLGLQLGDPPPGRGKLRLLNRGEPRRLPGVDVLLPAPCVDRLFAHLQVMRDLRYLAAGPEQVEDLAAELRRVTPGYADLSLGSQA